VADVDPVSASRAVLIEVGNVLGAFRDDLVVVGGWVPALLYPDRGHMGSLDVDLTVRPTARTGNAYQSILKRLTEAGYRRQTGPTRFVKDVAGLSDPVKVDLISGEYAGGAKAPAVQVDELQLSCLRGIDLAFAASEEREIADTMPDGTKNGVRVRVVRPEAFVLIKAFALDERAKDKDAYDIAFILEYYQPGLSDLADRVRGLMDNGLARQGYEILRGKFADIDTVGPVWAAQVFHEQGRDFEQARRAAFENAQELFRLVTPDTSATDG
jgi:hypothetical protein